MLADSVLAAESLRSRVDYEPRANVSGFRRARTISSKATKMTLSRCL